MTTLNKEDTTVNGVLVKDLSDAGQKLFDKLVALKKEVDDAAAFYQLKSAGSMELEEMSKTEQDEGFKTKLEAKSKELAQAAQQALQHHNTKQAALQELSNMILEEVNEIKTAREAQPTV
jgi:geranylgeranyl pyrophosphate synthase